MVLNFKYFTLNPDGFNNVSHVQYTFRGSDPGFCSCENYYESPINKECRKLSINFLLFFPKSEPHSILIK